MQMAKPNSTEAIHETARRPYMMPQYCIAIRRSNRFSVRLVMTFGSCQWSDTEAKVCEHSILLDFGSPKSKQFFSCFAISGELTRWRNIGKQSKTWGLLQKTIRMALEGDPSNSATIS